MNAVWERATGHAKSPEELERANTAFEAYRAEWVTRYKGLLARRSGLVSTMIAGRSNFPAARMNKRNDQYSKRLDEFLSWHKKSTRNLLEQIRPTASKAISADLGDAADQIRARIVNLETLQERFKQVNKVVRGKLPREDKTKKLLELGIKPENIEATFTPGFDGKPGIDSYAITNNNANIKRLRERLAQIEATKERPMLSASFSGGRVEENESNNRVQIFYESKPDSDIIKKLKSRGFHWSPSEGAWQRQRNNAAIYAAEQVTGVKLAPVKALDPLESKVKTETMEDRAVKTSSSVSSTRPRSDHALAVDRGITAKNTFDANNLEGKAIWSMSPNRSDLRGVDTRADKPKSVGKRRRRM
jgi:hypothetical protein